MKPRNLPDGDFSEDTGEMGSLYVDHDGQRAVVIDDYETYSPDIQVIVYAVENGSVVRGREMWTKEEERAFIESDTTAYLSGHNFPGSGAYGVFVGPPPNCPECGAFMSKGEPMYHGGVQPVGYTCQKYDRTNGLHEGYMTQQQAIDEGRYVPVGDYLLAKFVD